MAAIYTALKVKRGEFEALAQSESIVIDNMIPLLDIARPTTLSRLSKRIDDTLSLIQEARPRISQEFYIDSKDLPLEWRLSGDTHPAMAVAKKLAYSGYKPIHCFGFDRDDAYREAFRRMVTEGFVTRVALRLEQEDLKLLADTFDKCRIFLGEIGRTFQDADIFLDLRSIHQSTTDLRFMTESAFNKFKNAGARKVIMLASSMWDYTLIESNKINRIPRGEIVLWEHLREAGIDIGYGDYGVVHPSFIDTVKTIIPAPKFRYTTPTHWFVAKGEKPQEGSYKQHSRLARQIVGLPEFRTNDFCWGSEQIREFAEYSRVSTDSAGTIAIDTCTHLDITVRQIQVIERRIAAGVPNALS